jgi:hypothetical protein
MNPTVQKTPSDDKKGTIVVRPPAGTKARWVRQSQREGKKLTDWIVERVESVSLKSSGNDGLP